jgi:tetratricopeptide (TPR) repeat protein
MIRIVTFGNCQAKSIRKFLELSLPLSEFEIVNYKNNPRTSEMKSEAEILVGIGQADILIYQPLDSHHGNLSEENISKNVVSSQTKLISFPYIFNSGIYSLVHSPNSPGKSYGKIYGENIIFDLLSKYDRNYVLELYRNHRIDFDLKNRFEKCLSELARREETTDIKLSDFLRENYRKEKLFLTSNHPTTIVFIEVCRQIKNLTGLPIDLNIFDLNNDNIANLVITKTPITPYDISTHQYQFDCDKNWLEIGTELITKIANYYYNSQGDRLFRSDEGSMTKDFRVKINQARKSFETKNYSDAVKQYSEIVKNHPEFIPALSKLANSYEKMGSIERAINIYQRIIKLDPYKAKTQIKLAQLMAKQKNTKGAIQAFKTAISLEPEQPDWVYTNLGNLLKNNQ